MLLNSKSPSAVGIIKHGNAYTVGNHVHIHSVSVHVDVSAGVGVDCDVSIR